ncbi:MAG: TonB-dependent receptor domain-containing protein [Vulcanimicrobiaceae bacterium]
MRLNRIRRSLVAVLALVFVLAQVTWALASTTGGLHGTVVNAKTNSPLAGAKVTATSPSATASVTTDTRGNFSFLSLPPDTYLVTVEDKGFDTSSVSGITVLADQNQTVSFPLAQQLQVIGRVTSRSAADLVKPGMTADVYSVTPQIQAAAAPFGGGNSLSQAYSGIAAVPGTFQPLGGQYGWAQSVYVRGGNYSELGYEYDGVPVQRAYDSYPATTLSALGQQELQVYTGSAPGSAQSTGLSGYVNQVIKTGTYPGFGQGDVSIGSPTYYHKAQFEVGGASPNRNFSYYAATAGYNQDFRYVDQFNGASAQATNWYALGIPVAGVANACGTPAATIGCAFDTGQWIGTGFKAPAGYLWQPTFFSQASPVNDRESVVNIHFGIPHKNGGKDDIQLLWDDSFLYYTINDSYNALGGTNLSTFQNGGTFKYFGNVNQNCATNGDVYPCAYDFAGGLFGVAPPPQAFPKFGAYTGPAGVQLTPAMLSQVTTYPFPNTGGATNINPATGANGLIEDGIYKIQYTHQMGDNAFARLYGYTLWSQWPLSDTGSGYAFNPPDYVVPAHTRGLGLQVEDQLSKNLINFTAGLSTSVTDRWNGSFFSTSRPVAVLVNSTNPTGGCYTGAGVATYCGGATAAQYTINAPGGKTLQLAPGSPVLGTESAITCGTGPCEYLAVQNGLGGGLNGAQPIFSNASLTDTINVTQALSVDLGIRYDSFNYLLPPGGTPQGATSLNYTQGNLGRQLFTNSFNQYNCYSVATGFTTVALANTCAAGTAINFNTTTPANEWYGGFQPRVGFTYTVNPLNVLRASYGRFLQPSSSAFQEYNRADVNVASYDVPKFWQYGFTTPAHYIPPADSHNIDFSWEHQVKNSDMSWKITPFYRTTTNESMTVILDPVTNFVSAIPVLSERAGGLEIAFKKGNFDRNGLAFLVNYTYTAAYAKYQTLPGGSSPFDGVNQSIKTYNAYTSFCASNPGDAHCGATTNGATAAACYTAAGAPDAACAAGDIANPYWNAPVQGLDSLSSEYAPYNQTFGTGLNSVSSSYVVPHVASLLINYKHDRWNFTPVAQFVAGGKYGSPTQVSGIDPAAGCAPLPAGAVANDPRTAPGAAGWSGAASPFDASTCGGSLAAVPDPFTGKFDNLGAFTEPSELLVHFQMGYQASPNVKLNLTVANVFGTCFGGSNPPGGGAGPKLGCWYGASTGFVGANTYNPVSMGGAPFQGPNVQAPYEPILGANAGQQAYGGNVPPLELYFAAQIKL